MKDSQNNSIEIDAEAVDEALELLESAMQDAQMTMGHDDVRPSASRTAHSTRDAYKVLVEAHPDYELTGDD